MWLIEAPPFADHTELFKHFSDDLNFKKWLGDTVFSLTYEPPPGPPQGKAS